MAHSRPPKGRANKVKKTRRLQPNSKPQSPTPTQLINEATAFLHTGNPKAALPLALRALVLSKPDSSPTQPSLPRESLPALKVLAEINLELGDAEAARAYFLQAVDVDPEGEIGEDEGGGAEKFLWLAQLCEEGGEDSVRWFERGAGVLRREIAVAEEKGGNPEVLEEKKKRLAGALCGIIEVYMTDLSFDSTAETQCTTLITSALALAPSSPTPHQTHASILISQSDFPAAQAALRTSLSLWQHLPPSHPDVLDFPSRISLSRLLLEVGMEDEALEVLSGVVEGDESSVEGWYLGGWGLWLLAKGVEQQQLEPAAHTKSKSNTNPEPEPEKDRINHLRDSRTWLKTCLTLAAQLDYEDDRLRDHAQELVLEIEQSLLDCGVALDEGEEGGSEGEEWEGVDSEEDGDDVNLQGQEEITNAGNSGASDEDGRVRKKEKEEGEEEGERMGDVFMSGV